jgi:endonuclease YncB( thermonuclease family)
MAIRAIPIIIMMTVAIIYNGLLRASDKDDNPDKKTPAEITHCRDGDTCRVVTESGLWFNARLAGIDAPEVESARKPKNEGQPLGHQSRDTLSDLVVKKKNTQIRQVDLDPYNRPVIEIYIGEECINIKLLELGLAETYKGKTKRIDKDKYLNAESRARSGKAGIWGLKNYLSPEQWRRENKK